MKILMLSNCTTVESQGSGYVIVNTGRCLEEQGHEVNLVSSDKISLFSFLGSTAVIYRMMAGMAWWIITNDIKKYDRIIFYGGESALAVFLLKKVLRRKIPVILHSNGLELLVTYNLTLNELMNENKKKWYHFKNTFLFNYCYKTVDLIITVSKSERDLAINKLGINPNKIFYNNLALPNFYFNKIPLSRNKKLITFCGTWIERKGVDAIKKAMPTILKTHPEYKFRIIGVGNNFNVHQHFTEEIIDQIEVIPFVEDKMELMNLYTDSAVFLFPSISESFGLVVAEAMYCGCALISGPTGFAAELHNRKEAVILDKPHAENIILAIDMLINDEKLRARIAISGQEKVKNLTWLNYSKKLRDILNSLELPTIKSS